MMDIGGEFYVDGIQVAVYLTPGCITYTGITTNEMEVKVEADSIIACKVASDGRCFEVIFARTATHNKLEEASVMFCGSQDMVRIFSQTIQDYLSDCQRPRRFLVLVNPISGTGRGYKDYVKRVRPMMERCGIQTDVRVTKQIGEPTEILSHYDLASIDGVLSMGGDGFYCECMNGLIVRAQTDAGVDGHDTTAVLAKPSLPIGILPAGSGDYAVQYLHGTRCLVTAVLRILTGKVVRTNSASIHEDGRCLAHSGLILGFGLFGDMMYNCDRYRWMGSNRYNIIPLASLLKRRTVDVEIEYLPAKSENTESCQRSRAYTRQISLPAGNNRIPQKSLLKRQWSVPDLLGSITGEWRKTTGRVYAVDTHPISMVAKEGRMRPRFGDDALTMTLTEKCSISKHVEQLTLVKEEKPHCYDFDFVRRMKVDAYRVRLSNTPMRTTKSGRKVLDKKFFINCDGEAIRLTTAEFEVRYHRDIVALFGSHLT